MRGNEELLKISVVKAFHLKIFQSVTKYHSLCLLMIEYYYYFEAGEEKRENIIYSWPFNIRKEEGIATMMQHFLKLTYQQRDQFSFYSLLILL